MDVVCIGLPRGYWTSTKKRFAFPGSWGLSTICLSLGEPHLSNQILDPAPVFPWDLGSGLCDLPGGGPSATGSPCCSDMGPGMLWMLCVRQMGPGGSREAPVICFALSMSFVNRNLRDNRPALTLLQAGRSSCARRQWPEAGKRGVQGQDPT